MDPSIGPCNSEARNAWWRIKNTKVRFTSVYYKATVILWLALKVCDTKPEKMPKTRLHIRDLYFSTNMYVCSMKSNRVMTLFLYVLSIIL